MSTKDFRSYTKRHLKKSKFSEIFSNLSSTTILIILNVSIFLLFLILTLIFPIESIFSLLAIQPSSIFNGKNLWTIITSIFMHSGFIHLFVNMISLFFLGRFLETLIGKKRFLWLYLISGIFAGLFFCVFAYFLGNNPLASRLFGSPNDLAVGASGAIFAIAGVLAVITPKTKVYLLSGPIIAIILASIFETIIPDQPIISLIGLILNVYLIFSIFSMFSLNPHIRKIALPVEMRFWLIPLVAIVPLFIIGLFIKLPIGNMAHLGGYLAGLFYGYYLKKLYPRKTDYYSKLFS